MSMDVLLQQIVNGLVVGSVYALVALGYTMVYGILQLINFAHGEIVMIGGLTALVVAKWLLAAGVPSVLPLLISILIAMILLMSMPIRPATFWFSAVARIAVPILVLCTNQRRPLISATDAIRMTISFMVTVIGPSVIGVLSISSGNEK